MGEAEEAVDLASRAFGLNKKQQIIVVRILWVLAVTTHIAWICGWLTPLRIAPPFVRVEEAAVDMQAERDRRVTDRKELEGAIGDIRRNANAGLSLMVNRELERETLALCFAKPDERDAMRQYVDYLESLYHTLHDRDYGEPPCSSGRRR